MKRRSLPVFLLLLLIIAYPVQARSHRFLDLDIWFQIGADGVVRVIEEHTVDFTGTFSGMYQWIDTSRGVRLGNIEVWEDDTPYTRLLANGPGPPGTFYVEEKKDQVYIDWSFSATDQVRKFQLIYTLENVILKHSDTAEFYYQFVGSNWDQPRDNVRVTLTLPAGAELDEIRAWGHGPDRGLTTIVAPDEIVWEISPLPARTFLEGRTIFPNSLVPGAARVTNRPALERILAEEEQKITAKEAVKARRKSDPYLAAVAAAISYLLLVYLWSNYAKPFPGFTEKYYRELPADHRPAEVAILYKMAVDGRDLTATILDLARRRFLTIQETVSLQGKGEKEKISYQFLRQEATPQMTAQLKAYEQRVLDFLFNEIASEKVSLEELQDFAKENRKAFRTFWRKWEEEVKKEAEKHKFFDKVAGKQSLWFLLPAFLFLGTGFFLLILEMFFTAAVLFAASVIIFILIAVATMRRSPEGNLEYTKWHAFRRYLTHFSRLETIRTASPGIWEKHLPYGLTLGVADRAIKEWSLATPDLAEEGDLGFTWFIYTRGGFSSLTQLTNGVNSSVTQIMGQSGTGGSFSGGGGGGFGGGGGGVR